MKVYVKLFDYRGYEEGFCGVYSTFEKALESEYNECKKWYQENGISLEDFKNANGDEDSMIGILEYDTDTQENKLVWGYECPHDDDDDYIDDYEEEEE